jgi:hypothetical protein
VPDIEIRTAEVADLPALRLVHRRSSWSNEGDRALLIAHPEFLELSDAAVREGRCRLASLEGKVVGFVALGPVQLEHGTAVRFRMELASQNAQKRVL